MQDDFYSTLTVQIQWDDSSRQCYDYRSPAYPHSAASAENMSTLLLSIQSAYEAVCEGLEWPRSGGGGIHIRVRRDTAPPPLPAASSGGGDADKIVPKIGRWRVMRFARMPGTNLQILFVLFLIGCANSLTGAEQRNDAGVELQRERRLREAITEWDEAIRLDPQLVMAHYNRGAARHVRACYPELRPSHPS